MDSTNQKLKTHLPHNIINIVCEGCINDEKYNSNLFKKKNLNLPRMNELPPSAIRMPNQLLRPTGPRTTKILEDVFFIELEINFIRFRTPKLLEL